MFGYIDKRSKKINEYFQGLKIIKYYSWEPLVEDQIHLIRQAETKNLYNFNLNQGKVELFSQVAPSIISIAVFGLYIAIGEKLTPAKAFTILTLLNMI